MKTVAAIRRCLYALGGRTRAVACGLAGPEVAVRVFDLPALPSAAQLTSAIKLEAAQVCPFDVDEGAVAYDVLAGRPKGRWARARSKSERTSGILAAAKNDAIQQLRRLCLSAGVRCVLVDIDGLALLNCLEASRARKARERVMVLDVGRSYTNLAILSEDGQPFVRDIAYGSQAIIGHLCESSGASREAVTSVLGGAEAPGVSAEDWREPLEQACSVLVNRVVETVRYVDTKRAGAPLDRTFLCGGLARMKFAGETLKALLPGEVEVWNPLATMSCARRVRKKGTVERGPAFAVALGLAMRSLRDVQN